MAAVAWTPIAIEDIEGNFFYLARDRQSPAVAAQVVREISLRTENYAAQPLLAQARPELGESVRAFSVYQYVVFSRPKHDGIEVIRVIHGARDVESVFRQPPS